MNARGTFNSNLELLHDKLMEQGKLSEAMLDKSLQALLGKDVDLALRIIEDDDAVDTIEEE
ncbi:MAG: PhoU domain-containing protein, partial [Bacilli bacterium]